MPQNDASHALAIDIGGTKIAAALVSDSGALLDRVLLPTPAAEGAPAILATVVAAGQAVLDQAHTQGISVAGVGIGSAGHVDTNRGSITFASDNLPGWSGLTLAERVSAALGLPVLVDNDANALALGEQHFGAGRGFAEVLYVAVGTGVGGAVVRNGQLWRGSTWSAGEICHTVVNYDGIRRCSCGRTGHLEPYTSGPAMVARYLELAQTETGPDLHAVARLAQSGDHHACQAIIEGATVLGVALAGILNIIDPEALVVGGGVPEMGELWWQPFERALRDNPLPGPARVALRPAELGTDAVMIGAAWLVLQANRAAATADL